MGIRILPPTARLPHRLARLALALAGLTAPSVAFAAPPRVPLPREAAPHRHPLRSSYQSWLGFTATGPIHDPLVVAVDLVGGFNADMHPAAFVLRPALGVNLPHGFSVFGGYAYVPFWDNDHRFGEEHDVFQQVGYLAPFSEVQLFARIRGEERIRAGSDVGVRLRTLVQVNVPLWRRAPLQAVFSNELLLGLNQPADWQPELLDQNMFYTGVGWTVDPHLRVDVGYQIAIVPRRDDMSLVHSVSIGTTASW